MPLTASFTRGSVTHTLAPPVDVRGFRITGYITQSVAGGDWYMYCAYAKQNLATIDDNDETGYGNETTNVPFNEAPNEAAAYAKFTEFMNEMADRKIPHPAGP